MKMEIRTVHLHVQVLDQRLGVKCMLIQEQMPSESTMSGALAGLAFLEVWPVKRPLLKMAISAYTCMEGGRQSWPSGSLPKET